LQSKIIIFQSILTTFKSSIIFRGSWGSNENWLEPKAEPPLGYLACPNPRNTLYNLKFLGDLLVVGDASNDKD